MSVRNRIRMVLCLLVLFVVPANAFAQTSLERIVANGELRIGTSGNQPPFTAKSKEGELMGFEVDLANLIAESMGVKATFVEKPFAELLTALESGEVDVIMSGMTMTPERNMKVAFVGPYIISGKSILTKSATMAKAQKVGDIDQSTIKLVALNGSTSQEFAEKAMPSSQLTKTDDYETAVDMVLDGRSDAMVADFPICAIAILRHPGEGLATLSKPLTIEPIGMAMSPNDPLLMNLVENYLAALAMAGVLSQLEHQWFNDRGWLVRLP